MSKLASGTHTYHIVLEKPFIVGRNTKVSKEKYRQMYKKRKRGRVFNKDRKTRERQREERD